jgi:hypothetical protein
MTQERLLGELTLYVDLAQRVQMGWKHPGTLNPSAATDSNKLIRDVKIVQLHGRTPGKVLRFYFSFS